MKARTYLVAAQIYDELDRKDIALNFIHKAIIPAEKINDNWIKCYIYYLWGAILQDAADTDESSEKLELSLYFARELNDTSIIINRLYELSYNYIAEKDYATGLERLNLAIELAQQTKSYKDLALLYGRKSLAFYMLGNYREALAQINNAMPYNKYLSRKDSLSELNYKGKVLIMNNMPDSAQYYINQSKDTSTIYSQNVYYNSISMLKESLGDYKDALKYEKMHSKCLLQIAAEIENDKIAELNRQYDSARTEAENNRLKIENQRKSILALISTIIAITVIFATYANIARHRKKARAAMQQQLDRFNDSIKQMQQHENSIMAMQLKAREEAMTYAQSLNDKEKELGEAKKLLTDMRNYLLQNDKAVKKIYEILKASGNPKKHAKPAPLTDDEIAELTTAIDSCHDNFTKKLAEQFPALTQTDIYMCCLIKLGLDNPGLCAILDISDNTLRKRKYRLKHEKIDPDGRYPSLEEAILATTKATTHDE